MEWKFTQAFHKPYIIPTLYGFAYFLLIMNIFTLGYFRDNAPFHTVGLSLIIFGLVAMVHTNTNIMLATVSAVSTPMAEAGQNFKLSLQVQNSGEDRRYNLLLSLPRTILRHPPQFISEVQDLTRCELLLNFSQRGIYQIERIKISSRGIFGLFYAWKWCKSSLEIVIYPRNHGIAPLPLPQLEQLIKAEDGEEFVGHHTFRSGSSLKRVDWKAFARTDRLLIKDFQAPKTAPIELNYQDTPDLDHERKLEQLCAWIFQAAQEGRAFSLVLPHASLSLGAGSAHIDAALRLLASSPRGLA